LFKNEGYYFFTNEYITYTVDSTFKNYKLNINLNISNVKIPSDQKTGETVERDHRRYYFDRFFIYPDYKPVAKDSLDPDTLYFSPKLDGKLINREPYNFIYHNKLKIHPQVVTRSIFFESGKYYNLKHADMTYKSLSDLRVYRFVNIQFTPSQKESNIDTSAYGLLDTYIQLGRFPVQSFSIEAEGTNSAGDPGIAANFIYQNPSSSLESKEFYNLNFLT